MINYKKRVLIILTQTAIILAVFIGVGEFFTRIYNEQYTFTEGIEHHIKNKTLYGRIIYSNYSLFKLEMTKKIKPQVLVIGSSRVMQIRKQFFKNKTFYNAGGIMTNLKQGLVGIDEILNEYSPEVVIIGLDMWWFNPKYNMKAWNFPYNYNNLNHRSYLYGEVFRQYLFPSGKIKYLDFSISKSYAAKRNDRLTQQHPTTGIVAWQLGDGFRPDGSYQYGKRLAGIEPIDSTFADTKNRIAKSKSRFVASQDISAQNLAEFEQMIQKLLAKNIKIVLFLAPFPAEIYSILTTDPGQKKFFKLFRQETYLLAQKYNLQFFDFSNFASVESTDNEAFDGFHGSEKTYARLTLKMARSGPNAISPYIDCNAIENYLENSDSNFEVVPRSDW